jgi:hypothetical protein
VTQVTEVLQPGKGVHLLGWFFVELGIVNITRLDLLFNQDFVICGDINGGNQRKGTKYTIN